MKTLRPYQREAIDKIMETLQRVNSCVCVLPTGGGKTIVSAKLIQEWPYGNALFLAHTQELIYQSADKIGIEIGVRPHVEMGIQGAEFGTLWDGDMVVVGSVQSMISNRRLDKYKDHPFNLIIIDECHHATSASYAKVVSYFRDLNPNLKVVGITATPNRADKTALGLAFEDVAYQKDIGWMIDQGWLVPFKQLSVQVEDLDLSEVKTKKNRGQEADFSAEDLEAILTEEKTLHEMATPILEELPGRQSIVFTAGVKHAHLMADVLNRHEPNTAAAIDGTTDKTERKRIIQQFHEGKLLRLCNCMVLTEGFDAPATAAIVIGRPTKSVSLYTQMVGRGLRPLPGIIEGYADPFDRCAAIATSAKPNCIVLDFVGASRNGVVDCYDVLGGNYDVEVRELARESCQGMAASDVRAEDLELANSIHKMRRGYPHRQQVVARSQYTIEESDPYRSGQTGSQSVRRGGATDSQVALLVKLGVEPQKALGYSKSQARVVIDSISKNRCTNKQAKTLAKYGIDPEGISMQTATKYIDQISANGWKLPPGGVK
jgi:superfamily II DNA or RNA helicase